LWKDLLSTEVQEFIHQNEGSDHRTLALKLASQGADPSFRFAIEQIAARKKSKYKLPTWTNLNRVVFPTALSLEQSSSEATALFKSKIISGDSLVDLTGGLGVDTWAFSQSFGQVTHIEIDSLLSEVAAHNFILLGCKNITCINSSAEGFLDSLDHKVDYFFIDPARRVENKKVFLIGDTVPDITNLKATLLEKAKGFVVKVSPLMDIAQTIAELGTVDKIIVIAVDAECKELLVVCGQNPNTNPLVQTVDILGNGKSSVFEFYYQDERIAESKLSLPQDYLYEPNAACMKSGGFNLLATKNDCEKLHPNSHLYTSDRLIENFPGRKFKILAQTRVDKKSINSLIPSNKANIAIRNFPFSAADLQKKLGLKDGGDTFIFGTTIMDNTKVLLICEKAKV
jgi:precorrin-6B methylase 2